MLRRFVTACVGIPVVLFIIASLGKEVFLLVVLTVTAIALHEFFNMALSREAAIKRWTGIILGCLVVLAVFVGSNYSWAGTRGASFIVPGCFVFSVCILFFYHITLDSDITGAGKRLALTVFGIVYIPLLFSYVILIRNLSNGVDLLFLLLFVTWAGDTGAYIIGKWQGRHALSRSISPQKTVEGALGGLVFGILTALLCRMVFLKSISIPDCLIMGIGINFMNQFGDLSESLLKRTFDVKDSGFIVPGHGGMLDRIDSLLFAAPFLFYYVTIIV